MVKCPMMTMTCVCAFVSILFCFFFPGHGHSNSCVPTDSYRVGFVFSPSTLELEAQVDLELIIILGC